MNDPPEAVYTVATEVCVGFGTMKVKKKKKKKKKGV